MSARWWPGQAAPAFGHSGFGRWATFILRPALVWLRYDAELADQL